MFPVIELPVGGVSLQWVYNRVRDHLLKQGIKAMNDRGTMCLYRGVNNTACAAGCLIRDDKYYAALENNSVGVSAAAWVAVKESLNLKIGDNITSEHAMMLRDRICDLQVVHDQYKPQEWGCELERFAKRNGLVP